MKDNYVDKLLTTAINAMQHSNWEWPPDWDKQKKTQFLEDCNNWLIKNELYEQCKIVKDVQEEI